MTSCACNYVNLSAVHTETVVVVCALQYSKIKKIFLYNDLLKTMQRSETQILKMHCIIILKCVIQLTLQVW